MVEHDCAVRFSDVCVADRRPSTGSGLTEFFVRGDEDTSPRSTTTTTTTATKTVNTELVEVCLSALRVIDRRPSTSSGLTDVVVRGGEDTNPRSIKTPTVQAATKTTTAAKTVRPEPVEGLSFFRKTEQRSNTITRTIFSPNSLLTGVSD